MASELATSSWPSTEFPLGDAQSLQKRLFADAIGQRVDVAVLRNGALVDAVAVPTELAH